MIVSKGEQVICENSDAECDEDFERNPSLEQGADRWYKKMTEVICIRTLLNQGNSSEDATRDDKSIRQENICSKSEMATHQSRWINMLNHPVSTAASWLIQKAASVTVFKFILVMYMLPGPIRRRQPTRRNQSPYPRQQQQHVKYSNKQDLNEFNAKLLIYKDCKLNMPNDWISGAILANRASCLTINENGIYDIDDYDIVKTLGEGTFGFVHLIEDKKTNFKCALKKTNLQQHSTNEYQILNKIDSIFIISLFGLLLHGNTICALLEAADMTWHGYNAELVSNDFSIDVHDLRNLLYDALQGLKVLHQHGIQHRDIKPQNLAIHTIQNIKMCKLLDFGAASISTDPSMLPVAGTVNYLGPMAAKGERCLKDDIWSLGCSVLMMILNHHPWHYHVMADDNQKQQWQINAHFDLKKQEDLIRFIVDYCSQINFYIKLAYSKLINKNIDGNDAKVLTQLLCSMLATESTSRCTAQQALAHTFFNGMDDRVVILERMHGRYTVEQPNISIN